MGLTFYDPSRWYWSVPGKGIYSSAAAAYVDAGDVTYQAWLGAGNLPTVIDSEASLMDVLAAQYPAGLLSSSPQGQLRTAIVSTAQTAVGVTLNNLTAAQVKALLAILLYKAGGVNNDGTVRPLSQWVNGRQG